MDQHPRSEQRQPADPRHHQRLDCGPARRLPAVVKPDEQERGDRGELPEQVKRHEAISQHKPLHRPHEHQQERQEPALVRVRLQVGTGVENDQRTHCCNGQRKGEAQSINHETEVQSPARGPGKAHRNSPASRDLRQQRPHPRKGRERRQRQDPACKSASHAPQQRCRCRCQKWQQHGQRNNGLGRQRQCDLRIRCEDLSPSLSASGYNRTDCHSFVSGA